MIEGHKDSFDVSKLILALFVVGIHAELFVSILNPLFRTAVPLFFMMSSYFFFGKVSLISDKKKQKEYLGKFICRNLKLYFFWFVVLFPVTAIIREWCGEPVSKVMVDIIKRFVFNGTFRASWYIMALIIGISIVFFISRKITNTGLCVVGIVVYSVCCLCSNYYGLIEHNKMIYIHEWYLEHFVSVVNSWPASLLWIVLGKCIAENNIKYTIKQLKKLLIFSIVLLYCEQYLICSMELAKSNDCYVLLVPTCLCSFLLIKEWDIISDKAQYYRKLSTILYTTHATVISVLGFVFVRIGINNSLLVYICAIVIGVALYKIICKLEKVKYLNWLKYSY